MADVFLPAVRSAIMARIKGKNTTPEMRVRRLLHAMGFRYSLHRAKLPGKPDIVLTRHHKVIFIHGCFWHCHTGCPRAAMPTSNVQFWHRKLTGNKNRDQRVRRELRKNGWKVLVIWQCQLKNIDSLTRRLLRFLGVQPSQLDASVSAS